jgi:hypothetical protein
MWSCINVSGLYWSAFRLRVIMDIMLPWPSYWLWQRWATREA